MWYKEKFAIGLALYKENIEISEKLWVHEITADKIMLIIDACFTDAVNGVEHVLTVEMKL